MYSDVSSYRQNRPLNEREGVTEDLLAEPLHWQRIDLHPGEIWAQQGSSSRRAPCSCLVHSGRVWVTRAGVGGGRDEIYSAGQCFDASGQVVVEPLGCDAQLEFCRRLAGQV